MHRRHGSSSHGHVSAHVELGGPPVAATGESVSASSSTPRIAVSKSWGQFHQRGGDVGNRCSSAFAAVAEHVAVTPLAETTTCHHLLCADLLVALHGCNAKLCNLLGYRSPGRWSSHESTVTQPHCRFVCVCFSITRRPRRVRSTKSTSPSSSARASLVSSVKTRHGQE